MAKRNTIRAYDVPAYYHVYNRGAGKAKIFLDSADKAKFMSLLARYLDPDIISVRGDGLFFEKSNAKLVAYCLMGNHFHLFLYQDDNVDDIRNLISSVMTSYSMYFNLRHKRSGRLFEGPFRAVRITDEGHFVHLSRYIHLNPRTYETYKWSSLPEYTGRRQTSWVHSEYVTDMSVDQYLAFLGDYSERSVALKDYKQDYDI